MPVPRRLWGREKLKPGRRRRPAAQEDPSRRLPPAFSPEARSGGCQEGRAGTWPRGRARSRGLASTGAGPRPPLPGRSLGTASRARSSARAERRRHAAEAGEGAASEDLPGPDAAHRAGALPAAQLALQQPALHAARRLPQRSGPRRERERPGRGRGAPRPGARGALDARERGRRGGGRASGEAEGRGRRRSARPKRRRVQGTRASTAPRHHLRLRLETAVGRCVRGSPHGTSPTAAPHKMKRPRDRRPQGPRGLVIWAFQGAWAQEPAPFLPWVVK